MNEERGTNAQGKNSVKKRSNFALRSAKECAYIAVFVALLIGAQFALSAVPGIEVVTPLFIAYSFVFGIRRGIATATAFSLLRQFVFGVFPQVLVLYLFYYNAVAVLFGGLGKIKGTQKHWTGWLVAVLTSCVCTLCFTLLDNALTLLWMGGATQKVVQLYFSASVPVMITQTVCAFITVGVLFLPLKKIFLIAKKGLR